MNFKTFEYADISTAYLETGDLDRLKDAPNHLAELDNKCGDFFYTPRESEGPSSPADYKVRAKEHGMSKRFVRIMLALAKKGISYARFDSDGGEIEGLKPCNHAG